jgi:hypothetical protein
MNRRILLSLSLFAVASVLVLLAVASPVKSLQTSPPCVGLKSLCQQADSVVSPWPFWWYQTFGELGVGFAVVGALVLTMPLFSGLMPDAKLKFGRYARTAYLAGFIFGASVFAAFITMDWFREGYPGALYTTEQWGLSVSFFGKMGVTSLVLASVSLAFYLSHRGLANSLKVTFTKFVAPAGAFLQVGLFLISPTEMIRQATHFLISFQYHGVFLVSNWLVLVVSAFLIVIGLSRRSFKVRAARAAPLVLVLMFGLALGASLLLVSPPSARAASVFEQQGTNQAASLSSPYQLTCTLNTQQITSGDMIAVDAFGVGNGISSVSDGVNTYAFQVGFSAGASGSSTTYESIFTTLATTSPSSLTITVTYGGAVTAPQVDCAEFAGIGSATAVGTTSNTGTTTGTGTTYSTSMTSFTPTTNYLLLFFYSTPTCASSLSWSSTPTGPGTVVALNKPTSETGANSNCDGASDKGSFFCVSAV